MSKVYKNSTEVAQLGNVPIYVNDIVDACLRGRLNLFLQGDTGSGKTQLARDAMGYFPDKSLFILGRNDMDTRELFQQINLEKLFLYSNHILDSSRNLKPTYQRELENCLMVKGKKVDLDSINIQGLPTKEGSDVLYYCPDKDNNSVARFYANSGEANLGCNWDASYANAGLGVRAVRHDVSGIETKKVGGKNDENL